jgi:hypothetical protein
MKVASDLARLGPYDSTPTTEGILTIFHGRSVIRTCLPDIPHLSCDRLLFTCGHYPAWRRRMIQNYKMEGIWTCPWITTSHQATILQEIMMTMRSRDQNLNRKLMNEAETMFRRCLLMLCFYIHNNILRLYLGLNIGCPTVFSNSGKYEESTQEFGTATFDAI